jgi:hypothetical protein
VSDTNPLRQAALAYADRGWPVFALKPRDKVPATVNGALNATVRSEVLHAYWTFIAPDANIGLATGTIFDVIDIDGAGARNDIDELWPGWIREAPVVQTARGYHLYIASTGLANSADSARKLDFRGFHGYVLAPPSRHPSGHIYRWLNWPEPFRFPTAPRKLVEILRRPPSTATAATIERRREEDAPYDLVTLLHERYGPLTWRRRGDRLVTECPTGTHRDSEPSFTVFPDNHYHCFGCGAHGGASRLARDLTRAAYSPLGASSPA